MPKIHSFILAAAIAAASTLAACGSSGDADATVAVAATDKACDVADTSLTAGKIRFNLTNNGRLTTELYVLGAKDRVIAEVENVTPGMTKDLDVNLRAGRYTVVCKPGQSGEGIRQAITVTGVGGSTGAAAAQANRAIEVKAREYAFSFEGALAVTKGESIEFELANVGIEKHEFEVLGPDGDALGEIAAIEPGTHDDATFTFSQAGIYTYQCLIETSDGTPHKDKGMTGTFTVA